METELQLCIPAAADSIPVINNNYLCAQITEKSKEMVGILHVHVLKKLVEN